ncbi:MAG: hypothetical protein RR357_03695 [Clostridia bacterium]
MKKLILLLICFAMVFSLSACNSAVSPQLMLQRNWLIDWSEAQPDMSERLSYEAKHINGITGSYVQTFKKIDNTAVTVCDKEFKDIKAYMVVSELKLANDIVTDTVLFSAGSTDFQIYPPLASERVSFIGGKYKTERILYNGNKADLYITNTNGVQADTQKQVIELPSPYYDNLQLYTILRAATLSSKFSFGFSIYVPSEAQMVKLSCAYAGIESVPSLFSVGGIAQSYNCTKVSLTRNQQVTGSSSFAYFSNTFKQGGYSYNQVAVKILEGNMTYTLKNIETF